MKLIVPLFIIVVAISCSAAQVENKGTPKREMVSSILNKLVEATDPGVQYVVVNKNSTIFDQNIGLSNIRGLTLIATAPINLLAILEN